MSWNSAEAILCMLYIWNKYGNLATQLVIRKWGFTVWEQKANKKNHAAEKESHEKSLKREDNIQFNKFHEFYP